jgi:hypothetical protein
MAIQLRVVSDCGHQITRLGQGFPLLPFHRRLRQDYPYPPCGAKKACGHERRGRTFPCPHFLPCRLLCTFKVCHKGSCSRPSSQLVLKTGVRRARFRVVSVNQIMRITSDFLKICWRIRKDGNFLLSRPLPKSVWLARYLDVYTLRSFVIVKRCHVNIAPMLLVSSNIHLLSYTRPCAHVAS